MSLPRVEALLRKLAPLIGEKDARALLKLYIIEDVAGRRETEQRIELMYRRKIPDDRLVLVPPTEETARRTFTLGDIIYPGLKPYRFSLAWDELPRHILVTGDTGSGKTNLIHVLLGCFIAKNLKFWVFDRKGSFRHILPGAGVKDVLIFTPGSDVSPFYFNPNQPIAGIDPETILKLDIENLEAFYVGEGVKSLLLKAKHRNYEKFGLYSGKAEVLPTPADDLQELEKLDLKRRKLDWFQSAERTMEALCFGKFGKMLNVRKCPDITELARKSIIFEMLHLSDVQFRYLTGAILTRLYLWKRVAIQKGDKTPLIIVVDEAHHLFFRRKDGGEEHITDILLREGRSLGIYFVIADQFCSLLSKRVFGCYTKIAFSTGSRADMNLIADEWLLNEEEREWLPKLPVGQCIVKLKDRYPTPFLINVWHLPIRHNASDEYIRERMKYYSIYAKEAADERSRQSLGQIGPVPAKSEQSRQSRSPHNREKDGGEITGNEKELLIDIRQKPFSGLNNRWKRIKTSKYLGYKALESLKEKGLIRTHNIINKKSKVVLLEPTQSGIELLDSWDIKGPLSYANRHGDIVHQYYIEKVRQYREFLGYTQITKECSIGDGRTVDLSSLDKEGRLVIDEVEKDIRNAERNITKCIEVHSRGMRTGKVGLCVWMIHKENYRTLLQRLKSIELDKKFSLKVLYVRDHF